MNLRPASRAEIIGATSADPIATSAAASAFVNVPEGMSLAKDAWLAAIGAAPVLGSRR